MQSEARQALLHLRRGMLRQKKCQLRLPRLLEKTEIQTGHSGLEGFEFSRGAALRQAEEKVYKRRDSFTR